MISNRKAIVDLVNDGLKIEQDFRRKYYSKPWNLHFIFWIFLKDIIYLTGHTYFTVLAKRNDGLLFHWYRIISAVIFSISLGLVENFKIISLFHVSYLLAILNKSLMFMGRGKKTISFESIREISEMYDRLLIFSENICKLLRYRTTMVLINALIMISTEV
jgi:hypothetical protein